MIHYRYTCFILLFLFLNSFAQETSINEPNQEVPLLDTSYASQVIDTTSFTAVDSLQGEKDSSLTPLVCKDTTFENYEDTIVYVLDTSDVMSYDDSMLVDVDSSSLEFGDSLFNRRLLRPRSLKKLDEDRANFTPKEKEPEVDLDREVLLVINVKDSLSNNNLKAKVNMTLINENGRNYTGSGICNSKGIFRMLLTHKSNIILDVIYPNYIPRRDTITVEEFKDDTVYKTLKILKLEVGKIIRLNGVNFDQGKHALLPESYPVLNNLIAMMNANPKMIIKLGGHTDNSGNKISSQRLSEERVNEVRFYMIRKGIKSSRIKGEGYGSSRPIAHGSDPESLRENRRVEFEIIKL